MRRNNNKHGRSFTAGAIFGGLMGGLTALLLAPKTGVKMRKDLTKKCQNISDKTQDIMYDVCDQTCELVEKAKDIAFTAKEAASKISRRK